MPQRDGRPPVLPRWVASAVALLVSAVWAVAIVADIERPSYDVPVQVHIAFAGVLGALFGWDVARQVVNGLQGVRIVRDAPEPLPPPPPPRRCPSCRRPVRQGDELCPHCRTDLTLDEE